MEYLHARKDTAVGILVGNGINENRQGSVAKRTSC